MTKEEWESIEYFDYWEFDSPDEPGSGIGMELSTILLLDKARKMSQIPYIINSGFRTEKHNKKVGGSKNSSHLRGWAADIRVENNFERIIIVAALILVGFRRIGIADNFIHVDNDPDKRNSLWLYPKTFVKALIKSFFNSAEDI